jgi:hypothetical protein
MSRSIPAAILSALGQPEVYPFYAVEMLFDSGAVRLWTGYTDRGIGETIAASAIQSGKQYVIKSVGTTDFTLIGATSNTVGQSFLADGAGSGTGTVNFAYLGAGTLLSISGIDEINDLSAKSATISLNGISSSIVSLSLSEPYQRRQCRILFGVTNVSDFVEVFGGYMNTMSIEDSGETSNITLTVESKLIELNRPRVRRYTHESQKSRYPTDTFFSFVADLQDKDVVWGRKIA